MDTKEDFKLFSQTSEPHQNLKEMVQPVKDVFGAADYSVFATMLAISTAIGVYYAYVDRKKSNSQEYLMGGRSLSIFPVAMSSWHGFVSAICLLGTPAETYTYGSQFFIINLAFCFVIPATAHLYLPVFYNLRVTSAYEYLEIRFHRYLRTMGSAVFFIHMMMYMPVVLYAPALALSEVTGIKVWIAVFSTGIVCTFYTCIGGVKAVVWADCFQSLVMYGAILLIIFKGTMDLGGFEEVWHRNVEGGRVEFFRFDMDPTIRHTFWSLLIGGYVTWMGNYAACQTMIQRYLSIGTLRGAQICVWLNLPALVSVFGLASYGGLVIYAYYWDCDPVGVKIVQAPDQLFPRFVMETLGGFHGIPGLFVAGVFSGAIGTVSAGVNSLAAITLEDFIKVFIKKELSEEFATKLTKAMSMTFGMVAIALAFVAGQMGEVLQVAMTIHGIVGGSMLGLFTLGMFFPCANAWGAAAGLISGFIMSMWLGIGTFVNHPYNPECPMSYRGCTDLYYNVTHVDLTGFSYKPPVERNNDDLFYLYRVSYIWLSTFGFVIVIIVGLVVSLLTGFKKGETTDERLITAPVVWLCKNVHFGNFKKGAFHVGEKEMSLATEKSSSIPYTGDELSKKVSTPHL